MFQPKSFVFMLLSLFLLFSPLAHADDAPILADDKDTQKQTLVPDWVSEVRFGFLKHDVDLADPLKRRYQHGFDLNGEVFFTSPEIFKYIYHPRPSIGATGNLSGGTSHAYTDLNWGGDLENGLMGNMFFGFAVHDGRLTSTIFDPHLHNEQLLGSRVLFHVGFEGGYRFSNGYGLTAFYEHLSNGNILTTNGYNRGEDNIGLRIGYRFN